MDRLGLHSLCSTVFILGTIFSLYPSAVARIRSLPLPKELRDCYDRAQQYSAEDYVGSLNDWYCSTPFSANRNGSFPPLPKDQEAYLRHLDSQVEAKILPQGRTKRQAVKCRRKEYRMLTDQERQVFHDALNALKNDKSVFPNKFDALANIHTGISNRRAHGGPGFPGWHTYFLLRWEAALQEKNRRICLPYWDSSLDAGLLNPASSYIWSKDFLGNGDGVVTTGPFALWVGSDGVPLRRSVDGEEGQLFTPESIADILSANSMEEITLATAHPQRSLEFQHGGPHVFVGGDMMRLNTAARDPTFMLHHCFVDLIWWLIRKKMRIIGVNPEEYPVDESITDEHLGTAPMGFGNLTQADGFRDYLMSSYEYDPSPSCSAKNPDCGSKYLWCNVTSARCIPIDPNNPPVSYSFTEPCTQPRPQAYQNSFCVNGFCDIRNMVWVTAKIVSKRPPESRDYHSYPVYNGKINKTSDIYEPSANSDANRLIKVPEGNPKSYDKCEVTDGLGRIFVTAIGVNYVGSYKESSTIDQRMTTSISITHIAVKDPGELGTTEVLLRAHDRCGRVCHTACKVPGSRPPRYEPCSGLVQITAQKPLGYGLTYANATLQVFDYRTDLYYPTVRADNVFMTFYCDYVNYLPWVERPTNPRPRKPVPRPVLLSRNPNQCRLTDQCTINQPCSRDLKQCKTEMETVECINDCSRYAECTYGVLWPRKCPSGMRFEQQQGRCITGTCQNQTDKPTIDRKGTRPIPTTPPEPETTSYYGSLLARLLKLL